MKKITLNKTIHVTDFFDGHGDLYVPSAALGDGSQREGQKPLFRIHPGGLLYNLHMRGADGVHLETAMNGVTAMRRVVNEDVGEDAFTVRGSGGLALIEDCEFHRFKDKAGQINGTSRTIIARCLFSKGRAAIRSSGSHGDQPYRVHAEDCEFEDVDVAMMMTNARAMGWLGSTNQFSRVRREAKTDGGAVINR